jgi:hypothetical protein
VFVAAESEYLKRRAQQSLAAESVATDRSARLAHGQLAAAYARRATSGTSEGGNKGIMFPDAERRDAPVASPDPEIIT